MKTKVIYHKVTPTTDCADGITSAWVCHKVYPDADIEGCWYNYEQLPNVDGYEQIIIVDFSFPAAVLENWADTAKVVIIDHHKTAMNDLAQLSDRVLQKFDMDECGATLTWKYFFPNEKMPAFLSYVKDRDLWNFDLSYSEEIHEAIASLKYQAMPEISKRSHVFAIFDMLQVMSEEQLQQVFAPWGHQLLKPKRDQISEIAAAAATPAILDGHSILVVEISEKESRLISDLCSYLYKNNPEYVFVTAYYYSESGINLSFRSVSEVAKKLGGGGHWNAAGAVVKELPWN